MCFRCIKVDQQTNGDLHMRLWLYVCVCQFLYVVLFLERVGTAHDSPSEPAACRGVRRREQHARGGARARGALRHADGPVLRGLSSCRRRRRSALAHTTCQVSTQHISLI